MRVPRTTAVRRLAAGQAVVPILLSACGAEPPPEEAGPLVIVSVLPQAYVVERLASGPLEVHVMIPPGANEATYEPNVEQLRAMSHAVMYVKVGHPHFAWERAWLDRLVTANRRLRVVDGAAGCRLLPEDPHVWLSPSCVRVMAANVARELGEAFPTRAAEFAAGLAELEEEIRGLDAEVRERLAPYRGRAFLVFHPAWGYFASEYGLRQVAIQRGAAEPSTHELGALIARARAEGMRTVFVQPQFSTASAELVAREIGGSVVALDPLDPDWPAALRRAAAAFVEAFR